MFPVLGSFYPLIRVNENNSGKNGRLFSKHNHHCNYELKSNKNQLTGAIIIVGSLFVCRSKLSPFRLNYLSKCAEYVTRFNLKNTHLISEFSQDLQAAQIIFPLCCHVVNDVDEVPDA